MRPLFSYYGGKWRLAPRYGPPRRAVIVEPFAGGAGYSCRYGAGREVILVERYAPLAAAWRWLLAASPADVRDLPDVPAGGNVQAMGLPYGAAMFVGYWLGKGVATPYRSPSAMVRSGIRPASCWGRQVRERIAEQLPRMAGWRVIEGSYTDAPGIDAHWFIDPPYQHAGGQHYPCGSSRIDYAALGVWTQDRRGAVTACEGAGADWLPFASMGTAKGRKGAYEEAVWQRI